jgi:hypothetical protein
VADLAKHAGREGVDRSRPVQRDPADAVLDAGQDVG